MRLKFAEKWLTVPEIATQILLYLKEQASRQLNFSVKKVVITVPAHFNDAARGEVMLASKIAGLEVLRLIAEPTAASYAYGLHKKKTGCYLIYDLGGGTFDVSVLNMQTGVLQVIATAGDNMLGGDDIDYLVMKHFCNKYQLAESSELIKLSKKVKETLSGQNKSDIIYNGQILELDIEQFEQLILPLVQRTITITKDALEQAVPLSLGIELHGGITEKIILRNSPIPISVTKEFTTYVDNQTSMILHVLQGEREMVEDCRSLAKFELKLPLMKAGGVRTEVTFSIDA
ncbi:unnamed protein product, partial [Protopolystoma xenopodis]